MWILNAIKNGNSSRFYCSIGAESKFLYKCYEMYESLIWAIFVLTCNEFLVNFFGHFRFQIVIFDQSVAFDLKFQNSLFDLFGFFLDRLTSSLFNDLSDGFWNTMKYFIEINSLKSLIIRKITPNHIHCYENLKLIFTRNIFSLHLRSCWIQYFDCSVNIRSICCLAALWSKSIAFIIFYIQP